MTEVHGSATDWLPVGARLRSWCHEVGRYFECFFADEADVRLHQATLTGHSPSLLADLSREFSVHIISLSSSGHTPNRKVGCDSRRETQDEVQIFTYRQRITAHLVGVCLSKCIGQ